MKVCPTCKSEYRSGEVFCPVDASRLTSPSQMAITGTDPEDPLVGTTLGGRYKIIRRIGEGGMGIVYEAQHVVIEKRVALKVLRTDFSSRQEVVERFRQEAKSASRIGHEHIVDISDFGETPQGQSFFVMEFLEGDDLANILAREATLRPVRAARIALQCCRALGAAHHKGIVHRDMKPENIFLTRRDGAEDFVKIVDFGIAKMSDIETPGVPGRKLTKTGMIFGTPEYMSPEQAAGKELDHRVDIYAIGVILYEMVTGRVPFVGDSFMGILTQHMFETPPPLREVNPNVRIGPEIERVIFHALEKDRDKRYQTMEALADAIGSAIDFTGERTLVGYGEPVKAATGRPRVVAPSATMDDEFPSARRRGKAGLIAGGVALLAGAGVAAWFLARPPATTAHTDDPARIASNGTEVQLNAGSPGPESAGERGASTAIAPPDRVDSPPPDRGERVGTTPASVAVTVETDPPGAWLEVDGRGRVCSETPCTFETPAGESVVLRAGRRRDRGSVTLTPTQASTVRVTLAPVRTGGGRNGRRGTPNGNGELGELKVPDIFKNQ